MSWDPKIVRKKVVTYKDTTEVSFFCKNQLGSGEEWAQASNSITEMKLSWVECTRNYFRYTI